MRRATSLQSSKPNLAASAASLPPASASASFALLAWQLCFMSSKQGSESAMDHLSPTVPHRDLIFDTTAPTAKLFEARSSAACRSRNRNCVKVANMMTGWRPGARNVKESQQRGRCLDGKAA